MSRTRLMFKVAVDWNTAAKLMLGGTVAFLAKSGSDRIYGVICEKDDLLTVEASLKQRRIAVKS